MEENHVEITIVRDRDIETICKEGGAHGRAGRLECRTWTNKTGEAQKGGLLNASPLDEVCLKTFCEVLYNLEFVGARE